MGSIFYASGGDAEKDLYAFPLADALLAAVRAPRPPSRSRCSCRSRVKPFQPTLLLDGLIVSLAAGAVVGRPDGRDRSCTASRRARP